VTRPAGPGLPRASLIPSAPEAGGRLVQAHLARWSASPRIVIFWFSPGTSLGRAPHSLTAYNTAGHKLPAGHSTPGHG
jgi:hypothetical protein